MVGADRQIDAVEFDKEIADVFDIARAATACRSGTVGTSRGYTPASDVNSW
jgi:hypothetical protein